MLNNEQRSCIMNIFSRNIGTSLANTLLLALQYDNVGNKLKAASMLFDAGHCEFLPEHDSQKLLSLSAILSGCAVGQKATA